MTYTLDEIAQQASKQSGGILSTEDVKSVWSRHPVFAPGGKWFKPSDVGLSGRRPSLWRRLLSKVTGQDR